MKAVWSRVGRTPVGVVIVVTFFAVALFGPMLAPYDPHAIDLRHEYAAPSAAHPLGTTDNGVDILSALLHGARLAAVVGTAVTAISLSLGALLGLVAGYRGRGSDHVVTGLADLFQAFPAIVLQVAIVSLVARPGVGVLIFALSFTGWVLYARIARAQTFALRELEYVEAARVLGASDARIVGRHILPNLAGPLVIQATSGFAASVLAESTLSFLGLGPARVSSWGTLLEQGSAVLLRFPHVALSAGAAIALTVLGFNLAGDWLRDRLDPRVR